MSAATMNDMDWSKSDISFAAMSDTVAKFVGTMQAMANSLNVKAPLETQTAAVNQTGQLTSPTGPSNGADTSQGASLPG